MDSDYNKKLSDAKNATENKLKSLCDELNSIRQFDEPSYRIVPDSSWKGVSVKIRAIDPLTTKEYEDHVEVYVERVTKRWSSYEVGTFYVRINTNFHRLDHKRNWTFQTEDLAVKVHTKVQEFVTEQQAIRQRQIDRDKAVKRGEKAVHKAFPLNTHAIYAGNHELEISFTKDKNNPDYSATVEAKRRLDDGSYTLKSTPKLTEEQIQKILAIIWEEKQ